LAVRRSWLMVIPIGYRYSNCCYYYCREMLDNVSKYLTSNNSPSPTTHDDIYVLAKRSLTTQSMKRYVIFYILFSSIIDFFFIRTKFIDFKSTYLHKYIGILLQSMIKCFISLNTKRRRCPHVAES